MQPLLFPVSYGQPPSSSLGANVCSARDNIVLLPLQPGVVLWVTSSQEDATRINGISAPRYHSWPFLSLSYVWKWQQMEKPTWTKRWKVQKVPDEDGGASLLALDCSPPDYCTGEGKTPSYLVHERRFSSLQQPGLCQITVTISWGIKALNIFGYTILNIRR